MGYFSRADVRWLLLAAFIVGLFVIVGSGWRGYLAGMASAERPVTYRCLDNDILSTTPLQVRGTVTISSSKPSRQHFTDFCVDTDVLREYSCDAETGREAYKDVSCAESWKVCTLGRCRVP